MTDFSVVDLSLDPAAGELTLSDDSSTIRRSILPGGIRLLTESVPGVHTAAVGLWIGAGSADEVESTFGSTHFLEHLLFKGTESRSAQDIAHTIDFLGGNFNAGTGKQLTYYYGHVVDEDMSAAVDLLADMVMASRLDEADMAMERGVILEELAMYADDASDVAHEAIATAVFGEHPMGRPIGGTKESVTALAHGSLAGHYASYYRSSELVVTAAGRVNHDQLAEQILAAATSHGWDASPGAAPVPRRERSLIEHPLGTDRMVERPVEQSAVILAMPAMTEDDPRRYSLYTLSAILGGGTSSRLFQEIREKRGLAYSTYAFPGLYREGGMFGMYAGCSPEATEEVSALMRDCLEAIAAHGVTDAEVESAFRRTRADHAFGSESVRSRMTQLGQAEVVRGRLISQDESLRRSRAVTADEVVARARELVEASPSRVVVGPAR